MSVCIYFDTYFVQSIELALKDSEGNEGMFMLLHHPLVEILSAYPLSSCSLSVLAFILSPLTSMM